MKEIFLIKSWLYIALEVQNNNSNKNTGAEGTSINITRNSIPYNKKYITAVMLLHTHTHTRTHTQVVCLLVVPQANYGELKSIVSLLFPPCHNSRTPWSQGEMCFGWDIWVQISALLLASNVFRDRLCNPLNFTFHMYKMEIIANHFLS